MKQSHKTILLWVALALIAVFIYTRVGRDSVRVEDIPYTEFTQKVEEDKVARVVIHSDHIEGEFTDKTPFRTGIQKGLITDTTLEKLTKKGIPVSLLSEEEGGGILVGLLLNALPILLVVVVFFLFMRQLQSGGGKAMSFGKSKAKLLSESHNKVTFNDVAGIDEAKEELNEIIEFLKDPKKFTKLGGRIPKGVLLMGSPGTGKTLLAKAIAGEAGVPFFSISGSDFVEMFVGVGASRVRDLFEQGKKNAPCIIFIDEIDAVGRHRGAGLGGGHDEREQTLNQLLVEMDGFESNDGVILIAATNRPDVLDPALQRPGRFDRRVVVPRPDIRGREGILSVHMKRVPKTDDVDISILARGTPGFSGADLENLVNEAALLAARANKDRVDMRDFENAKDKVMMGPERRSLFLTEEDRRRTAYHEAGHALVATKTQYADPLHKVTIIPRGMALGLTWQLPEQDRLNFNKKQARATITVLMGGRVADEMIEVGQDSGAANDIERATRIARAMVCEWGMSDRLGPLAFGQKEGEVFLGREFSRQQDYSEATAVAIDEEVRRIVNEGYQAAKDILASHTEQLHTLAKSLLEYETLDAQEIDLVLRGETLPGRTRVEPRSPEKPSPEKEKKNRSFFGGLVPETSKA